MFCTSISSHSCGGYERIALVANGLYVCIAMANELPVAIIFVIGLAVSTVIIHIVTRLDENEAMQKIKRRIIH